LNEDHLAGVEGQIIGESATGKRVRFTSEQAHTLFQLLCPEDQQ
jgi:hypothetical protein